MRTLLILVAAAAPAWAQNAARVVRPVPALPFAAPPALPVQGALPAPLSVLPSGAALTAAPTLKPTLALPHAAVNAVANPHPSPLPQAGEGVVRAVAAPRAAEALPLPQAGEGGVRAEAVPADDAAPLPVNRRALGAAARTSARARTRARAVSEAKVPSAAAAATFFDGASEFPEMVESAAVDGFVRELREPARVLREMGVQGTVTVYGSARIPSPEKAKAAYDAAVAQYGGRPRSAAGKKALSEARAQVRASRWYAEAQRFGALVVQKSGGKLAVVSGGGPGIMEGANRGAFEAGGKSVGYNILLPHEQSANPYLTKGLSFDFTNFTTRKMNLRHGAMGLAYFPGGFGTMDELFEVLTLMQTGKMPKVPIVLVGEKSYWNKILRFREFAHQGLISKADLDLFEFAETADEAWSAIESHYKK